MALFEKNVKGDFDATMIDLPNKKYQVIYADPPYHYESGAKYYPHEKKGTRYRTIDEYHYPTMKTEEIKKIPISIITDSNCALFLWCPCSHLPEALEIMTAWGFEYRTIAFIWIKKTETGKDWKNISRWTMKSAEVCLLGIIGKPPRTDTVVFQIIRSKVIAHSKKPDETRIRIEQLCGKVPRIELFARQRHDGWDAWGNELSDTIQQRIIA